MLSRSEQRVLRRAFLDLVWVRKVRMKARQVDKPLVSVVIPTLNRPTLLLRAINSVLRQSYQAFEVIVVVDRPDPDTVDAVQSVNDPRVRLIRNPYSLTAAGARNGGADQAMGEW